MKMRSSDAGASDFLNPHLYGGSHVGSKASRYDHEHDPERRCPSSVCSGTDDWWEGPRG